MKHFQQIWQIVKSFWEKDDSYTFMLVPDDGSEIKKTVMENRQFRVIFYVVGVCLVAFVGTVCSYSYMLHANAQEEQELAEFRKVRQAQEQKLQELSIVSENVQREMAQLNELELEVKKQMAEAGMEVPGKEE